jgi:hypothetical protein
MLSISHASKVLAYNVYLPTPGLELIEENQSLCYFRRLILMFLILNLLNIFFVYQKAVDQYCLKLKNSKLTLE